MHSLQLLDHRWSIRRLTIPSTTIFGGQTPETKPSPDCHPRILTSPDHPTLSPALRFLPKFPINYFGNPAPYNPWGPAPFPTSVRFKSKPELFPDTVRTILFCFDFVTLFQPFLRHKIRETFSLLRALPPSSKLAQFLPPPSTFGSTRDET